MKRRKFTSKAVLPPYLYLYLLVLVLTYFPVAPTNRPWVSEDAVIVTQLLNIAKKSEFEEAQNHSELETSLFACQFVLGVSVLLQLLVTRVVFT